MASYLFRLEPGTKALIEESLRCLGDVAVERVRDELSLILETTRAGLITGRYQTRFGHEFNPAGGAQGLPLTETTIANRLKANGEVEKNPG
jgi:hypothetical protein